MGIRTDPGYKLYATDCSCWSSGHTPKKLYLSIAGVKPGASWVDTLPKCPNGIWICEYVSTCTWSGRIENFTLSISYQYNKSYAHVMSDLGIVAFTRLLDEPCKAYLENELINPGLEYYDGWASIMSRVS